MARMVLRTTGELVGREGILQQLSDALGRAAAGEPTVVVVSGETGVGKTRLVTEFMARASATTLWREPAYRSPASRCRTPP